MVNAQVIDFEDRVLDIYITIRDFQQQTGIDIGSRLTFGDLLYFYKSQTRLILT